MGEYSIDMHDPADDRSDDAMQVLRDILSQPTAPFHEERVAARIAAYLRAWGIPFGVDAWGNLIAHYQCGGPTRPLLLMAHMDHPGFEIVALAGPDGEPCTARLLGGVARQCFERAGPVAARIYPGGDDRASDGIAARITGHAPPGDGSPGLMLSFTLDDPARAGLVRPGDFGVWDLPDMELRDGSIHARAIDDLAGCAAILLTMRAMAREQRETDVYGVFTRAEEVGLVGAYAALRGGTLPRGGYIVSLEASKALPGAVQGEGPVIRVGDRASTFCDEAEGLLRAATVRLGSPEDGGAPIPAQRQLMSGGQCEATAAVRQDYATTGLAFPLGNYHNVGDGFALRPEHIRQDDFLGGVALLQEAARLLPAYTHERRQAAGTVNPRQEAMVQQLADTAAQIKEATRG